MLTMFSPVSLEAQKLISVSIGKINASRVTRTGTSLHKSLLVASVLQKARNVYLDEERERALRYPQCHPPELTVTPVSPINNPPEPSNGDNDKENTRLMCREDEVATPDRVGEESRLPLAEANTGNNVTHTTTTTTTVTSITNTTTITTTSSSQSSRKRRRVSDQETAAAVSSILPKRLRSELKGECLKQEKVTITPVLKPELQDKVTITSITPVLKPEVLSQTTIPDASLRLAATEDQSVESAVDRVAASSYKNSTVSEEIGEDGEHLDKTDTSLEDSDSDGEESASDTSTSSGDEMEVDQLTSLVSYFSFSQSQKQSEFCLGPIHSQSGPHVVALTA